MTLVDSDRRLIAEFRDAFERRCRSERRYSDVERDDRSDGAMLSTRVRVADRLWLDVSVRPFVPQVRVGIVTDDRWRNEDLEDKIEESGDTMSEFIEMGFEEAGLEWIAPPVEHFREQGRYFCFTTPVELPGLGALCEAAVQEKLWRMFEGYYAAFRPAIVKAAASE